MDAVERREGRRKWSVQLRGKEVVQEMEMEVGRWNNRTEESDTTSALGTVTTGEREGEVGRN